MLGAVAALAGGCSGEGDPAGAEHQDEAADEAAPENTGFSFDEVPGVHHGDLAAEEMDDEYDMVDIEAELEGLLDEDFLEGAATFDPTCNLDVATTHRDEHPHDSREDPGAG